jgi:hypothetical protein
MLYVFVGEDVDRVRAKSQQVLDSLCKKQPDATTTLLETEQVPGQLEQLISAQGLFVTKNIVLLKWSFDSPESKASVLEHVAALAQSDNIFILTLRSVDVKSKKLFEKHAQAIEIYAKNREETPGRNLFVLGDLLVARDKKNLWRTYQEAVNRGHVAEELHGILFWAVKNMLLSTRTTSASEAGLKSFVYSKFKRAEVRYTQQELEDMSCDLVVMYHEAHNGTYELPTRLEQWILEL